MTTETSTAGTRARLLDAAEELLARGTYDTLSVRAVCSTAGANPAAVHYHFGSKERLIAALLEDRLEPIWVSVLDGLAASPVTVREIVDALIDPLMRLQADASTAPRVRLLAEFVLAHPRAEWAGRWSDLDGWATLLTAAVPDLDVEHARRRLRFAFTVLMTELTAPHTLSPDTVEALREFLTAGLAGLPKDSL
ncbi:TetR/AcrR family transcriptional regulator [Gordonia hydrophobica]|uniref:TetR/AcrR family transcriptional regulator n=1 Tax=Gordonia hydrophobica TaxID=40516 RepID=A0ABZ2U3W5_9ACTN|nr:TetR/AcrR family transcriptional regulator [Gordonia hydrophobica]MBM7368017.1 AcrR family transcriptional regulator [Gordonia hydrophobica]